MIRQGKTEEWLIWNVLWHLTFLQILAINQSPESILEYVAWSAYPVLSPEMVLNVGLLLSFLHYRASFSILMSCLTGFLPWAFPSPCSLSTAKGLASLKPDFMIWSHGHRQESRGSGFGNHCCWTGSSGPPHGFMDRSRNNMACPRWHNYLEVEHGLMFSAACSSVFFTALCQGLASFR